MRESAFVYILRCHDETLYTGWTSDLEKRLCTHNQGKGSRYTRARLPVRLIYFETHLNRSQAMRREYELKKMSRRQKLAIIAEHDALVFKCSE